MTALNEKNYFKGDNLGLIPNEMNKWGLNPNRLRQNQNNKETPHEHIYKWLLNRNDKGSRYNRNGLLLASKRVTGNILDIYNNSISWAEL